LLIPLHQGGFFRMILLIDGLAFEFLQSPIQDFWVPPAMVFSSCTKLLTLQQGG
jgi:hypothetical protein